MSKYHIRDKFVIEIDEVFENNADDFIHEKELYRIKGFNSLVFDDNGLDKLQKYETFTVRPDAWDESLKEQYNKGLEDGRKEAWELAKKISDIPTMQERADIFGFVRCGITVGDILRNMDYQEALAKLEAYEKEQEIKVGDVVSCTETKGTAVVAKKPTDNEIYILWNDGSTGRHNIEDFKKTGKHIDISSILEQIGGGE